MGYGQAPVAAGGVVIAGGGCPPVPQCPAAPTGAAMPTKADLVAALYVGHQFVHWEPQLGDGRTTVPE